MVLKFITMKINCLLTFLVGNMVQLFHHFIKITVSCHEIKTLYLLYSAHDHLLTCSLRFATTFTGIEVKVLAQRQSIVNLLLVLSANTTVVWPYNHPSFILLVYMFVVI